MTQIEFLEALKDALQREEDLSLDMALADLEEWDSLAIISLISLFDAQLGRKVSGNDLRGAVSVRDLLRLAKLEG